MAQLVSHLGSPNVNKKQVVWGSNFVCIGCGPGRFRGYTDTVGSFAAPCTLTNRRGLPEIRFPLPILARLES